MRRGYSSSGRSVQDLPPPPSGRREQCSPPQPGDSVWIGDTEYVMATDGSLLRARHGLSIHGPVLTRRQRMLGYVVDLLFCTACIRLRFAPGHLLLCQQGRTTRGGSS